MKITASSVHGYYRGKRIYYIDQPTGRESDRYGEYRVNIDDRWVYTETYEEMCEYIDSRLDRPKDSNQEEPLNRYKVTYVTSSDSTCQAEVSGVSENEVRRTFKRNFPNLEVYRVVSVMKI